MNMENIPGKSVSKLVLICRLCGNASDSYKNIFGEDGIKYSIHEKILTHLRLEVSNSDLLPKIICNKCFDKLDEFHNFFVISKKIQMLLKNTINESLFSIKINIELPRNEICKNKRSSAKNNYKIYLFDDKKENTEIEKCFIYKKKLFSVNNKNIDEKNKQKPLLIRDQNFLENDKIKNQKILKINTTINKINILKYEKDQGLKKKKQESTKNNFVKFMQENYKNTENSFDSIYQNDQILFQKNVSKDIKTDSKNWKDNCNEKSRSNTKYKFINLPVHLPCTSCTQVFMCAQELIKHYSYEHHGLIKTFKCFICGRMYKVLKNFYKHYRKHNSLNKHVCEVCGKSFTRNWTLRIHASVHSDAKPFNCDECSKTFKNLCSLKNHKKSHLPDECKLIYTCTFCGKSFKSKFILTTHERIHTGQKDFTCDICTKSFSSKSSLLSHILIHNNNNKFYCTLCNKLVRTEKLLKRHLLFHSIKKKLKCEYCGKEFHYSTQLNEHIRLHTGELPFECEYCQKRFRLNSTLTIHRRQHTGIKPYKCNVCDHSFTNWPNYNKHMKRKHYNTIIKENNDELILLKI